MKRVGHLWNRLIAFDNLLRAARTSCKGKRFRPAVAAFHFDLERQLWRLHEELATRAYRPGPYTTFHICEPKERLISAAPYRDRVVHHALTQVLEPIFERSFSPDSYACRKGKGTHAAVDRCQEHARRFRYVLKADVRKFFPSIDHPVLKGLLARKVKDGDVLWLADSIIDHSNPQEEVQQWFAGDDLFAPGERRRGLPLGNQTSQFFANVYLDPLDHFVADRLRAGAYVRYCDDFLVFADDKARLADIRGLIADLLGRLRLRLHPDKNVVFPIRHGIAFLGYRIFRTHRLLAKANVWRFRRRLRHLQREYARRALGLDDVRRGIVGWIGHARQADTWRLRRRLFCEHPFRRTAATKPFVARRCVQQPCGECSLRQPQRQWAGEPQRQHRVPPGEHFATDPGVRSAGIRRLA
jgi:retron-type reverse transcriptase